MQLSNCGERQGLWEHIGNSWSQLAKPAKRWIRETEITVVEKYCIPGKGLKPSGTWHTNSALTSACVQVLLVRAKWQNGMVRFGTDQHQGNALRYMGPYTEPTVSHLTNRLHCHFPIYSTNP